MTGLTEGKRDNLAAKDVADPDKRVSAIEDKAHACNGKARASQTVKAGRMSKVEAGKVDKKADVVLKT